MSYCLPPITQLTTLPKSEQTELLNHLFEPHSTIHKYLSPLLSTSSSYKTYPEFIESCRSHFFKLDPHSETTKDIVSSHPRLGIPRTDLSVHSKSEQAKLQSSGTDATVQEFIQLNADYEAKYPGLKFVLFVNSRDKEEIKVLFKNRIETGSYEGEVKEALNAMCDIALDRYKKLSGHVKL